MIQFNLLPDVKLEYIKAQRVRRSVTIVSIFITIVAVALFGGMLAFNKFQQKQLENLSATITTKSTKLTKIPQLNKILTVQNQLQSLTQLHEGKPQVSQLFGYLNQVTPSQVSISTFNADFTKYTVTLSGDADALSSVNKYVDTLKATNYTTDTTSKPALAFSSVVLSTFSLNTSTTNPKLAAAYTITMSYDKNIFDITQKVKLNVPSQTNARGTLDSSSDLFTNAPAATAAATAAATTGGTH